MALQLFLEVGFPASGLVAHGGWCQAGQIGWLVGLHSWPTSLYNKNEVRDVANLNFSFSIFGVWEWRWWQEGCGVLCWAGAWRSVRHWRGPLRMGSVLGRKNNEQP